MKKTKKRAEWKENPESWGYILLYRFLPLLVGMAVILLLMFLPYILGALFNQNCAELDTDVASSYEYARQVTVSWGRELRS